MTLQHYGWPVSPYSAKTRSYLKYQPLDFTDTQPTARQLYGKIQKAVGRMIMPTLQLADGQWLQDSSAILDHFEAQPGTTSVVPGAPAPAVASSLLEVFADEWLPMAALHYRWNLPDNARFAVDEFARYGIPWMPRRLGRRLIRPMAKRMAGYLPILGVDDATIPGLERTTQTVIQSLEHTLAERPYLFGGRPSLGDFAMYGPLWAHLYRDPGSRHLFDDAPAVVAWMDRLTEGATAQGEFETEVSAHLDPLFQVLVDDQLAWNRTLIAAIDSWCAEHPDAHRVPRALGTADFVIGGCSGRRKLITFVQWKAQRSRDAYDNAAGGADAWLSRFSERPVRDIIPAVAHPFAQVNFKTVLRDA